MPKTSSTDDSQRAAPRPDPEAARPGAAGVRAVIVRGAVRRGAYHDSVALMRAQQALRAMPGIDDAGIVMGTDANLELLSQAGLAPEGLRVASDDLVASVRADTAEHADHALAALDGILARRPDAGPETADYRPRTAAAAARLLPGADLALISVPGRFAAGAAHEALGAGLHVMVFSDNVPLEDEVRLKQDAARRGRLLMGPDCGTALVGGAALGFANRVRRGPVGIVSASGTGLQEVATIVHRRRGGVSHALGTGGRDVTAAVGGAATRAALGMLGRDAATTVIVLISKPPDADTAGGVLAEAARTGKPVVVAFVGTTARSSLPGGLHRAATLEDAADIALRLAGGAPRDAARDLLRWHEAAAARARGAIAALAPSQRYLRGLYSGGTFCAEAVGLLEGALRPLFSNAPVGGALHVDGTGPSRAHTVLDLGDDRFTVGRLHPMLDLELRGQRLGREAGDPEAAVLLLDVVLGEGVHPDPAGSMAPAIASARAAAAAEGRALAVVASVCGTDEDPQRRASQVERLAAVGVLVEDSNARAAVLAGMIASRDTGWSLPSSPAGGGLDVGAGETHRDLAPHPEPAGASSADELLARPVAVVNVGLAAFAESLRGQGVPVVDLEWRPPAGGDRRMMALLERLG